MVKESRIRKVAQKLGFVARPSDVRSVELPIVGSPNVVVNPVNLSGLTTATGPVTTDRAIGLAAVYRAVNILATDISQLELGVWRGNQEIPQPTTSLVVKPNYDISLAAFLEQTVMSLALTGNAYWLLNKSGPTATVGNISVLDPTKTRIEYRNGKKYFVEGSDSFPEWKVKHLMYSRLPGYDIGVGPIQACQNELRGALTLRNFADNWFTDSGIPTGILSTDQSLSSDMAQAYKDAWDATAGNGIKVVGNGLSFQPIMMNPADAQWLEAQRYSAATIALMFGVPGIKMDLPSGDTMTYSNREDVISEYIQDTLMKYINEIESALSDILPRGQVVRFKVESLLRANTTARYAAYQVAINAGFMTIDEVRALEGLPPLTANPEDNGDSTDGS